MLLLYYIEHGSKVENELSPLYTFSLNNIVSLLLLYMIATGEIFCNHKNELLVDSICFFVLFDFFLCCAELILFEFFIKLMQKKFY